MRECAVTPACVDWDPLLPAWALDALDDDECAAALRHIGECASCRDEARRYAAVAAAMALALPQHEPPPGLKARLLDAAISSRPIAPRSDVVGTPL
jgi:hypothetical protein